MFLDVTDPAQVAAAADLVASGAVEAGLDGLVNNAGIAIGGAVEAVEIEDLRHQLEVNFIGQAAVTKALLPYLRVARGRVVFVGSVNGRLALPFLYPYSASKYAIEALADSLRGEVRPHGVEVSVVEPGAIDTPMRVKARGAGDRIVEAMSADQERLYGKAIAGFLDAVAKGDERATRPEKVADAIVHALTSRRPRTRYLIGLDARSQVLIRRLLPDRLGDRIVALAMRG